MDEFFLDFMETPPKSNQNDGRTAIPISYNELDMRRYENKHGSKKFKMAQHIAKVDELLHEIDQLKSQNIELQQQLKDFQVTAKQVQDLYIKEKNQHSVVKHDFEKLQKDYHKIDADLTNKSMVNEQMKARLAEYDGRPICYNDLVVKYIRMMNKIKEDDIVKYFPDRDLIERLGEYCAEMKIRIRIANSPKKSKSKGNKIKNKDTFVQCDLLKDNSFQNHNHLRCSTEPKMQDQSTQCVTTKHDQASQYISTMITRQTNTEKFVQKHVQTMYPETPAIDDILRVYSKWSNIRSVSPLLESPPRLSYLPSKLLKHLSTTGTCTMLCNIRRKIDYLPLNNVSNVKQEIFTPSGSPTPTSNPITSTRSRVDSLSDNMPGSVNHSSILDLFNSATNSSLGQLSSNAFNELWQIFGKILLSLLQTNNASAVNANQITAFNQQQFLDWLLDLYSNSQPQTTSTVQTQTLEETDPDVSTSPLSFNETSVLPKNVVRPQPQKKTTPRQDVREDASNISLSLYSNDNVNSSVTTPNATTVSLESISQDCNSMNRVIPGIQKTSNTTKLYGTNLLITPQTNNSKEFAKSSKKIKTKYKIINQIQELLPEINLSKMKVKALKRLFKINNHRKKSFGTGKNENVNGTKTISPPVIVLSNEDKNDDTMETAVDFLKAFAEDQENNHPVDENFSENEKIFLKQISNQKKENCVSPVPKSEEFTFTKPDPQAIGNTSRDTFLKPPTKHKKAKTFKQNKNKYQLLFGDSDNEFEEQDIEMSKSKLNHKTVIENTVNLSNGNECLDNTNDSLWNFCQDTTSQSFANPTNFDKQSFDKNLNQTYQSSPQNDSKQFELPNMSATIFKKLSDVDCFKNAKEYMYFVEKNTGSPNNELMSNFSNIENCLENDIESSSKQSAKNDQDVENINKITKTEAELNTKAVNIKATKDVNEINKHKEQNNRRGNISSYNQTEIINTGNSMSTLGDSLVEMDGISAATSSNSLHNSNEDSIESSQFPAPMYPSDFEKDFELSSDDASLISEHDNNTNDNRLCEESFISKFLSISEDDSIESEELHIRSTETMASKQEKYVEGTTKWNESFEALDFNECISETENEPVVGSIYYRVAQEEQQLSLKEFQTFESKQLTKNNQSLQTVDSQFSIETKNLNTNSKEIDETNQQKDTDLNNLVVCSNKIREIKVIKNFNSQQQTINSFNTCKESLKTARSSIPIESEDECNFNTITNIKNQNRIHKLNPSFEGTNSESENIVSGVDNSYLDGEIHGRQSHSIGNKSINQFDSTVSDITLNAHTLINDESVQLYNPESKFHNITISSEISGLSSLKLLDINNVRKHQRISCDSMTNHVEIKKPDEMPINTTYKTQDIKAENNIISVNHDNIITKAGSDISSEDVTFPNISKSNEILGNDQLTAPTSCLLTKVLDTNINGITKRCELYKEDLCIGNINDLEISVVEKSNISENEPCSASKSLLKTPTNANNLYTVHNKNLNEHSNIECIPKNDTASHKSTDTIDEFELSDSLSIENELMIDEDDRNEENNSSQFESDPLENSIILTESGEREICDDIMDSTNISNLLNSTLYTDILTETVKPLVDDLVKEEVMTTSTQPEIKSIRGRKRKSECLADGQQPCKRSQRLIAKQMILEESLILSKTSIELGKYTKGCKNVINNIELISPNKDDTKKNCKRECESTMEYDNLLQHDNMLQMGFFRERDAAEEVANKSNKTLIVTTTETTEISYDKTFTISEKQEEQSLLTLEPETQNYCNKFQENSQGTLNIKSNPESEQFYCHKIIKSPENCIYSDSPKSPTPIEANNEQISQPLTIIPLTRLPQYVPQDNVRTQFDVLINSYKYENKKQFLESVTEKECKRQENILQQLIEQLKLYCYDEMELDLFCTSTRVINKLLSISADYNLIQKALITIAQNSKGTNVPESDLPSIIQEMPPRHLSKCLQRLFTFLKNVVTRNSSFCKDLTTKIEVLLFNSKGFEKTSLQSALNLTQLYLMATKVQEYLQIQKHPARLFIAKCLYFYFEKAVLMIHEVIMWYPTVLPCREDKTYDRSDALISVIQQILMSTKYDMERVNLRGKTLLSKLRYEYHFEPFKPPKEEVINILVEKLKTSKFYNIFLAFGLLCKRIGAPATQYVVLNQHLLPLANEYYSLALKTNEYDKRIAVLLEVISILVKPLPIEADTQKYFNEFARFLNGFERQLIQEAALCSILRLQQFNVEYCYNLLRHFRPAYNLNTHTQAMLKTFIYRRPLPFWKNLVQNTIKFN